MHEDHFPYSVALTSLHMTASFVLSSLVYLVMGDRWFPSALALKAQGFSLVKKFIPLAVLFAVSILLSNEAYLYCTVPFLQMCKEFNVAIVYFVGLVLMVERFNLQQCAILFVIMIGCCMSIHGEMRFNKFGFMCQIAGQTAEACKIVLQQQLIQGFKLDPLTMVMVMSPLCLIALLVGLYFSWEPGILLHAQENALHLFLNCSNAFALNVAVASLIKYASGVSFVLAGVIKDVCIVLVAAIMFGAHITRVQGIGFSIAVIGVGVVSIIRSMPDIAAKHGVHSTLCFACFGTPLKSGGP